MTAAAAPILRKPPYRVARARLSNGLRLLTIETPHLHSATICLYVRAGSRYERPETNGLSHFLEHMLFRGSARYPSSFALNLAIEELGGTLYAETGRDYSLYQICLHPSRWRAAWTSWATCSRRPRSATSTSSARSSSRRSSRTSTIAGAT